MVRVLKVGSRGNSPRTSPRGGNNSSSKRITKWLVTLLLVLVIGTALFFGKSSSNSKTNNTYYVDKLLEMTATTTNSLIGDATTASGTATEGNDQTQQQQQEPWNKNDPAYEMNKIPAPDFHLVVSTGCSTFQDWQSYVLFFHAMKSGQVTLGNTGGQVSYVTRVASGCSEEEEIKMREIHEREIAPIAPGRFFLHHTPLYQFIKPNVDYKYFNKAFGYQHWMVNALRYPYNHEKYDNVTYILLDPDQIMLRPFLSNNFSTGNEIYGGPEPRDKRIVEQGQVFAQEYAFGINFFDGLEMDKIAPKHEMPSPLAKTERNHLYAFMVGPPYIMKGYDLWRLVNKWCDFNPYVMDQRPGHITEMYAYSIAAAHLKLKHQVMHSLMVSNVNIMSGEGWDMLRLEERTNEEDVCTNNIPVEDMPHVLHYCQHYGLGKHFFSKYLLPGDFISCQSPLIMDPPADLAIKYNYHISPGNGQKETHQNKLKDRRYAFGVCHMTRLVNEAAIYYKKTNCAPSEANYNKTFGFHKDMSEWVDPEPEKPEEKK